MPSKNKPNGYWTFKTYHAELDWSDQEIGDAWRDLSDDLKTEWKEYAKNGGAPPRGYGSVRIPEPTTKGKKAKKPESRHKPDTSSSVDQESMMYNPHLSREVQQMIDERKAVHEEKMANVRSFSAILPGSMTVTEAKSKTIVFIHMFPLYDGDEKSYNLMQWHPSIIYAARFSLEKGVTHQYHAFTVADDVSAHVERAQMLNEGRCQVLHGADRMATGPRLPIPGVASSAITGNMFSKFEADYSVIINNLANLICVDGNFDDSAFGNVVFAHPTKTQTPDLEDNWMFHCLEQELMLRRLLFHAKAGLAAQVPTSKTAITKKNIKLLESFRIQPLGYYWCSLHAMKRVPDVNKDDDRRQAYIDMIAETRILLGRRQASLVVRPYMKCEYHATEDNKVCMPAEARTILAIMFSDLLSKYNITDTKHHNFTQAEEALRSSVKKTGEKIVNVFDFSANIQLLPFGSAIVERRMDGGDGAASNGNVVNGNGSRSQKRPTEELDND